MLGRIKAGVCLRVKCSYWTQNTLLGKGYYVKMGDVVIVINDIENVKDSFVASFLHSDGTVSMWKEYSIATLNENVSRFYSRAR